MNYQYKPLLFLLILVLSSCKDNNNDSAFQKASYNQKEDSYDENLKEQYKEYLVYLLGADLEKVFNLLYPNAEIIYLKNSGLGNFEEFKRTLIASVDQEEVKRANNELNAKVQIDKEICDFSEGDNMIAVLSSSFLGKLDNINYWQEQLSCAISKDKGNNWLFFSIKSVDKEILEDIFSEDIKDSTITKLFDCIENYRREKDNLTFVNDKYKLKEKIEKYFNLFQGEGGVKALSKYIYPKVYEYVNQQFPEEGGEISEDFFNRLDLGNPSDEDISFVVNQIHEPVIEGDRVIQAVGYKIISQEGIWKRHFDAIIFAISSDGGNSWKYFELDKYEDARNILEIEHSKAMVKKVFDQIT